MNVGIGNVWEYINQIFGTVWKRKKRIARTLRIYFVIKKNVKVAKFVIITHAFSVPLFLFFILCARYREREVAGRGGGGESGRVERGHIY
jgi:hypothetical protein